MTISIIGTGYVGLVTGACLADNGHVVHCIDNNQEKLELLKKNISPIYEPGLEELISKHSQNGNLIFSDNITQAVEKSEAIFLCLPTPANEDGSANLSFLLEVSGKIGEILASIPENGETKLIINKSTAPVGTAKIIKEKILSASKSDISHKFEVASNPEFLRQGTAVMDSLNPERIVLGANSSTAIDKLLQIYSNYNNKKIKILVMDTQSAELTKYAANSFLAMKITFANQLSNLCEKVGANIDSVIHGLSTDSRISPKFLKPGIGFGGSCFPKDVSALYNMSMENDYYFGLLDSVIKANKNQKQIFIKKIKKHFGTDLSDKVFGIWGLAFKAGTDDIRDAPSIEIVKELSLLGAKFKAYDPKAMNNWNKFSDVNITLCSNKYDAVRNVNALLILTEWQEFTKVNLTKIKKLMKEKNIFDGRNIFQPNIVQSLGFNYISMGRK